MAAFFLNLMWNVFHFSLHFHFYITSGTEAIAVTFWFLPCFVKGRFITFTSFSSLHSFMIT